MTDKRLIEVAFPLKQVSLDSVHEKGMRHGHIPGMTATLNRDFQILHPTD